MFKKFNKKCTYFLAYTIFEDFEIVAFDSYFDLKHFLIDLQSHFKDCDIAFEIYKGRRI